MDGLFFACLMGICGSPAAPAARDAVMPPTISMVATAEATSPPPITTEVIEERRVPAMPAEPATPTDTAPTVLAAGSERHASVSEPTSAPKSAPTSVPTTTPGPGLTDAQALADAQALNRSAARKVSKQAVAEVVRRRSASVKHCYELGLREQPRFSGTIDVGWKIDVAGHVSSVNVVGATSRNRAAEECLLAEIPRWEFSPSAEPTAVTFPFVFDAALLARHSTPLKPSARR